MKKLRYTMIGGFLGAGKTTTVARLAKAYQARGLKVGIVTNDQAQNLVDTNNLRAQGLDVQEVPGACFCCKFDDLVGRVRDLGEAHRPDIILAEPVGSCTDLVATVIQPLKDLYRGQFEVGPYSVLFKPSHGLKILRREQSGFSPKAAYIFNKQLEEADAIIINRADELSSETLAELHGLLAQEYPGRPVLAVSAKTGQGFDEYRDLLDSNGAYGQRILTIDYDTYAEGEAELGWLNTSAHLKSTTPFAVDPLLTATLGVLHQRILSQGGEVAHLKAICLDEMGAFGVANVVSSATAVELSLPSNLTLKSADLIVNARVAIDPQWLEQQVFDVVQKIASTQGIDVEFRQSQSLRPGRPTPTHRYETTVG